MPLTNQHQHQHPQQHRISARIAELKADAPKVCATAYCGRPTMAAAGKGLTLLHCKKCTQARARHGSFWCPTIPAATLRPYVKCALDWIRGHKRELHVTYALMGLQRLLDGSGQVEPAMDIKRRPSADKARVAFARLREAGVKPERLLAIHLGVAACLSDDSYADSSSEYRLVQVSKACWRLASGTHRKWLFPADDGGVRPLELHVYPMSSGRVLRIIGRELEELCGAIVEAATEDVRTVKRQRHGPHPSASPNYKPPWQVARDEAAMRIPGPQPARRR